jgi:hypothetical protein
MHTSTINKKNHGAVGLGFELGIELITAISFGVRVHYDTGQRAAIIRNAVIGYGSFPLPRKILRRENLDSVLLNNESRCGGGEDGS